MKRILALVVSLLLVLSLSSALAEEKTTIEFFCVKEEVQSIFQEIINDFEAENPDIHVELTYASDGETVLLTRIASNEVPDTMSLYPAEQTYRQLLDEGYIMDLTDCGFESNVEQAMLDLASYNGSQISLPYTLSLYGIHYNKTLFTELGIQIPTTMDELIEVCKTLKEAGYDAFALPFANNANQIAERLISAFDGNSYVDFQAVADGEKDIHDVASLTALADFIKAIKPYSSADAMGMNNDSAHADFVNKKAAMRLQGSWYLSTFEEAKADFEIGLFGIPSPVTGKTIIPVNIDTGFSISATTKYPDACMKWIEYLSRTEVAQKYYTVDGNINMIKGVTYDREPYMDVYNTVMAGNMSLTQINLWQQGVNVRSGIAAAIQNFYMDEDYEAFYQTCYDVIIENYE